MHICCNSEPGRNADASEGKTGGFDATGKFWDKIILLADEDVEYEGDDFRFFLFLVDLEDIFTLLDEAVDEVDGTIVNIKKYVTIALIINRVVYYY